MSRHPIIISPAEHERNVAAELARMTALFQQRAIAAHLGFGPTAQRPPHTPIEER